jgi:pimeloyl-ACP methyl ester carboxylesterase
MTEVIPWDTEVSYSGIVGDAPEKTENIILFLHGNGRSASDWLPHFKVFKERGVSGHKLWALTFDNTFRTHNSLATQLEDFIVRIRSVTEADMISIVAHSLSVTVGRLWLEQYNRYNIVDSFVGLAGANHGLPTCPPRTVTKLLPPSHSLKPCTELVQDSLYQTQIQRLNETVGETPSNIKYYTIRGKYDAYFVGDIDSPALNGAEENILLETDHDGTRASEEAIEYIYQWVIN